MPFQVSNSSSVHYLCFTVSCYSKSCTVIIFKNNNWVMLLVFKGLNSCSSCPWCWKKCRQWIACSSLGLIILNILYYNIEIRVCLFASLSSRFFCCCFFSVVCAVSCTSKMRGKKGENSTLFFLHFRFRPHFYMLGFLKRALWMSTFYIFKYWIVQKKLCKAPSYPETND